MMDLEIRAWTENDLPAMLEIWNEVVEAGRAFPQMEPLDMESGREFFAGQTACGVAESAGKVLALYILHPNNIGRCGHICNASYAVAKNARGRGIGEVLVGDSLKTAAANGFRIMQFNAVAVDNAPARALYRKIGFRSLGIIPGGFLAKDGKYVDIELFYYPLA